MIVKNEIVLEFVKGDNCYRLSMNANAPIGEIYDVGFQIIKKALELAQDAAQKAAPAQQELSPIVEPVVQADSTPVAMDVCAQNCNMTQESVGI